MDVNGAKALKRRLGSKEADETPPVVADVPDDAPPVYHWFGVGQAPPDAAAGSEDDTAAGGGSSPS